MRHTNQQLDNVSIVWGGKTTVPLDTGAVLSEIALMTNLNNDQLLQVQIKLGGDVIYDLTGEDLRMLEAYKKAALADGVFIIPFDDISGRTEDGQNLSGLVTTAQDNLVLILKVAAKTAQQNTDGDVPEIAGFIRQRARKTIDGKLEQRTLVPRKYVSPAMLPELMLHMSVFEGSKGYFTIEQARQGAELAVKEDFVIARLNRLGFTNGMYS